MDDDKFRETMNVEATPENFVSPRGGNWKGNDGSSIGLTVRIDRGMEGVYRWKYRKDRELRIQRGCTRAYSVESGLPGSVDRCPGRAAIYNHPCSLPPSLAPTLSLGPSPSLLRLSQLYAFKPLRQPGFPANSSTPLSYLPFASSFSRLILPSRNWSKWYRSFLPEMCIQKFLSFFFFQFLRAVNIKRHNALKGI